MAQENSVLLQLHVKALARSYVHGRQVHCKELASSALSGERAQIEAQCSVCYCGADILLILIFSHSFTDETAHGSWQLDVIPEPESFAQLDLCVYDHISLECLNAWDIRDPLSSVKVIDHFIGSLQAEMRKQLSVFRNDSIMFHFEALQASGVCDVLISHGDPTIVTLETVLLPCQDVQQHGDMQKLCDVLIDTPVWVSLRHTLKPDSSLPIVECSIRCPEQMPLTAKAVKGTQWNESTVVYDVIPGLQEQICRAWARRSAFIQALRSIACVMEYDAVDCSFATVVVRVRLNRASSMCAIDLRFPPSFPSAKPLVTVHGLQDGFSKVVEDASIPYSSQWDMDTAAKAIFIAVCELILVALERSAPEEAALA